MSSVDELDDLLEAHIKKHEAGRIDSQAIAQLNALGQASPEAPLQPLHGAAVHGGSWCTRQRQDGEKATGILGSVRPHSCLPSGTQSNNNCHSASVLADA
eukprot:scaffold990_cov393-Prasinococcus_capsulatus_cf.AAC.24